MPVGHWARFSTGVKEKKSSNSDSAGAEEIIKGECKKKSRKCLSTKNN